MSKQLLSSKSKHALANALYELVLITFPIGLYVSFEAFHKKSWNFLITSPEWGIAIIFLIFVGISNYIASARKCKKQVNETMIKLWNLIRLIGIVLTVLISFCSVMWDNMALIIIRISLLVIVTIGFIILLTSSELMEQK